MLSLYTALSGPVLEPLCSLSPAQWCQAFFILASSGVLAVAAAPAAARKYLLDYGARTPGQDDNTGDQRKDSSQKNREDGNLVKIIASLTSWTQVPHSWFIAFYATSLACSIFWLAQYLTGGWILGFLISKQAEGSDRSMTLGQVILVWTLMVLQAGRRLYEHLAVSKPSNSTMWIVHWLLGIAFYVCASVSVWIEGSGKKGIETRFAPRIQKN